jgi:hypothetical protein
MSRKEKILQLLDLYIDLKKHIHQAHSEKDQAKASELNIKKHHAIIKMYDSLDVREQIGFIEKFQAVLNDESTSCSLQMTSKEYFGCLDLQKTSLTDLIYDTVMPTVTLIEHEDAISMCAGDYDFFTGICH